MKPLAMATAALLTGAAVGATGTYAIASIDADIRVQTDSLRLEAQRKQGARVTVIRRLAGRIDSIAVAWKPEVVVDTTTPPDTTTRPDTSTPPGSVPPADTSTPPDTLPPIDTTRPDTTRPPLPTAIAELPRFTWRPPIGLDLLPCTVHVTTGLQLALNVARDGDVICLAPGATFRGSFQLPARSCGGLAVLRTAPAHALSLARMTPSLAAGLARLEATNQPALRFPSRSCGWHVLGLEVTSDSTLLHGPVALVEIGGQETNAADLPTAISFDRVYVHGWPKQHIRRAFSANGAAFSLTRSWCDEIHASGYDSQCLISWGGSGPMMIEDNELAAASENLMFGGGDPKIPGMVPSDITIRRNSIRKPIVWKGAGWNVKNLIETKSSARVLVEENVLEGVWTDGQVGYAFVLKSTSQNSTCRPCGSSDWTIRRNLVRNAGAGFSIAGQADQRQAYTDTAGVFHAATGTTDSTNRRFAILENWVELLNVAPYNGDGRPMLFTSHNHDFEVRGNVFEGGAVREAILFNLTSTWPRPIWNLTLRDNVLPRGQYGVGTTSIGEGLKAWVAGATGISTWSNNALFGRATVAYPSGTIWFADLTSALGTSGVSRAVIDAGVRGVVVPR